MRISIKTDYALKTLLDLALNASEDVVPAAAIARRQDIPVKFLEQILLSLKSAGVVASKRGPKGGYYLVKKASEISVGAVLRLTEGSLSPITFTDRRTRRSGNGFCPFQEVWQDVERYVNQKLDGITIQDMCDRASKFAEKQAVVYVI